MKETLSVITICFNNLDELVKTCRSVEEQTASPFEHIIVDGSTNEDIFTWLKTHPQPPYRKWVHERDNGISDAFNKGIRNSTGSVTHILNSGDVYYRKDVIEMIMPFFETDPSLMWTHALYVQHRGGIDVISGVPFDPKKLWRGMRAIAHPSMFIRREVYDRCGVYGVDYRVSMDYDMLVRMRNEKFRFIDIAIVYFAPGGMSQQHFSKGLTEVRRSYHENVGPSFKMALWHLRQRVLQQFMRTAIGRAWFKMKNKKMKV